eukprot:TRINITY_DN6539_c0_g1_i1.p1 TRINITY_DN6539_c0_g1~~TRINITY_DN6539_c0_g1_i1.p1  ORF type:complete len:523 (-),score=148.60 TRINITY_DN6539_c0_g1_i1:86-1654(-)
MEQYNYRPMGTNIQFYPQMNGGLGYARKPTLNTTVFWDFENCPIPANGQEDGVTFVTALRNYAFSVGGELKHTYAIGNLALMDDVARKELQKCGVSLHDVPSARKSNQSDFAILSELFKFVLDNPPPQQIVLISGDSDFTTIINTLRNRLYEVTLIHGPQTPKITASAASVSYLWSAFLQGKGANISSSLDVYPPGSRHILEKPKTPNSEPRNSNTPKHSTPTLPPTKASTPTFPSSPMFSSTPGFASNSGARLTPPLASKLQDVNSNRSPMDASRSNPPEMKSPGGETKSSKRKRDPNTPKESKLNKKKAKIAERKKEKKEKKLQKLAEKKALLRGQPNLFNPMLAILKKELLNMPENRVPMTYLLTKIRIKYAKYGFGSLDEYFQSASEQNIVVLEVDTGKTYIRLPSGSSEDKPIDCDEVIDLSALSEESESEEEPIDSMNEEDPQLSFEQLQLEVDKPNSDLLSSVEKPASDQKIQEIPQESMSVDQSPNTIQIEKVFEAEVKPWSPPVEEALLPSQS